MDKSKFATLSWLIKTDINGEILWEKFIGGEDNNIGVALLNQNINGDIYLCGSVGNEDNSDPIILKINACGEKEWCRKILTTSNNDFFSCVATTNDGGCSALIFGAFLPIIITGQVFFGSLRMVIYCGNIIIKVMIQEYLVKIYRI